MSRKAKQPKLPFDGKRFARTCEQMERLEQLKHQYGVTDWAALAHALAADFVPGFKTACSQPRRTVERRK